MRYFIPWLKRAVVILKVIIGIASAFLGAITGMSTYKEATK